MYNDEKNLYHYTYRRDGSETGQEPTLGQQLHSSQGGRPVQEMKPVKKSRLGLKITALALACALMGGAAGGGAVFWAMDRAGGAGQDASQSAGQSQVLNQGGQISAPPVTIKNADGVTPMTDAEVYAANVNSVVAITTSGTAGNGYWSQPTSGAGSGFILTPDGYIATNYHVIQDAEAVKVTLYSGETYDARIISGEEDYDIAVIKIEAEGLKPVTMGDSTRLTVGERVLVIGNPLGTLNFSQTGGMISSVNRAIDVDGVPFNMIQTDASINPGNSGGPMFNQYGQVVGIVSAKYTNTASGASVEGLGFAIPINDVAAMIQDIMTNGYATNKPYLGIQPMSWNQQLAAQFRYDISEGVFVSYVEEGGAADQAGLRMGDVITKLDDTKIASYEDLVAAKKKYAAGDTSTLTVYRQGETFTVDIVWGSAPEQEIASGDNSEAPADSGNGGNSGNGYLDPNDFFSYFFGNRYW